MTTYTACKISSDQDKLLLLKMLEREKYNANASQVISRDKTDHRNYLEIRDEIEKETRKELSITKDFMFYRIPSMFHHQNIRYVFHKM